MFNPHVTVGNAYAFTVAFVYICKVKIRIGIFFGGSSREREISFAGGRTVYDNLDKALFEPVPVFVDSLHNFILLDWQYIYKGTIRDFFPPVEHIPDSSHPFQIYEESLGALNDTQQEKITSSIGKRISPVDFTKYFDFAFLALHGAFGEDGTIQGLFEFYGIPYSGSGVLPSAAGINKAFQKQVMAGNGFASTQFVTVKRSEWNKTSIDPVLKSIQEGSGFPVVVKPANQGSSVGVSIVYEGNKEKLSEAINKSFFIQEFNPAAWVTKSPEEKIDFINAVTDIRSGIGLPVTIHADSGMDNPIIYHPELLLAYLNEYSANHSGLLQIEAVDGESEVIIEEFIEGKEFSCIVIVNENGKPVALPPTEIIKGKEVYDYRSKYLAGLSRKTTPIQLPEATIEAIRSDCERLFSFFGFHVYARIDGFLRKNGDIILNDPNTTSGMLPSSFFFHQAAEIGLNPSQFLTYIIHTSLEERIRYSARSRTFKQLLTRLDAALDSLRIQKKEKIKIAVILGGYSSERHISVESGRNVYEKLSSSDKYAPVPVFLTGNNQQHELYRIPINLLLKDNADDIRDKIEHFQFHPVVERIKEQCSVITKRFSSADYLFEPKKISYEDLSKQVNAVFIALHGRPGEDGAVQQQLEKYHLPYNGSGVASSQTTINKYKTNQLLLQNGFHEAKQTLVYKKDWVADKEKFISNILSLHSFPFIAKPVDDGCSSAVKKIKTKAELESFVNLMFRNTAELDQKDVTVLKMKQKEEFPAKNEILIEDLIAAGDAEHFLEITCGILTHLDDHGEISYEVFEPSETLAGDEVLSLEEKFLAGEGQNITPARFAKTKEEYTRIAAQVKKDLEKAARLLNVTGYCRIDAFVRIFKNGKVETVVIEVNSLPGMTPATCIFHQAAINHYKPYHFIDKIMEFGFNRQLVHSA